MKLLCIDGNSVFNRAFYGIKLLTTKNGEYTNAIFGFMNILLKLEQAEQPDAVAVAFDLKGPTFRHEMYKDYKGTRKGMPEELAQQMPVLKELLTLLGYKMATAQGYEADDVLGTLSAACVASGDECIIATGDRDSFQLVSDKVNILLTTTKFGHSETEKVDEAYIFAKYGLTPKALIEVKALQGDASDNIPGVPGVGEKTALALIQRFGTVAGVYENIDDENITNSVRTKLINGREKAEISLELARIVLDAPVDTAPQSYVKAQVDATGAAALLARLEMTSILNRLNLTAPVTPVLNEENGTALENITPQVYAGQRAEKSYAAPSGDGFIIVQGNAVYTAAADNKDFIEFLRDDTAEKLVFDAKALHKLCLQSGGKAGGITFCAKLAAYLLNPAAPKYTLTGLLGEYALSPTFACDENEDAAALPVVAQALLALCEEQGMLPLLQDIELPLSGVLAGMEEEGFLVDADGIRAFGEALQGTLQASLANIYTAVGHEFNVNSPKQLSVVLFEELGLPTGKKTKSGFSTDAETLEGLRKYSPVVDEILTYRSHQKLNSTYVEGLLKQVAEDGRVYSVFNQTETRTGRISSNEPNLQNIPVRTQLGAQMRKFFVAREGWTLLDADYSQIELRILAHISGDQNMLAAFHNGEDIHRATAARVYGVSQDEVTAQMRSSAKAVNFGIVYGIGAFSLAKDIGVSVKEADAFIKNYLTQFSGVRTYMDDTIAYGTQHGYVQTLYGRRRNLPELRSSNRNVKALGERMAMNTPIQGTAADIIKLAMVRVAQRLEREGFEAKLILQVHDELIIEAPLHEAKEASEVLQQEMANAAALSVPLLCEVTQGENWYEAKG